MKSLFINLIIIFAIAVSCRPKEKHVHQLADGTDLRRATEEMAMVMLRDNTNPPLAARFFAYSFIAGYEVLRTTSDSMPNIFGITDTAQVNKAISNDAYVPELAALFAIYITAAQLQPSGKDLKNIVDEIRRKNIDRGITAEKIDAAVQYASQQSKEVIDFARKDGYTAAARLRRYSPQTMAGAWFPTPPGYFGAVEPYFQTLNPILVDSFVSANKLQPTPFDHRKGSSFYKAMMEIYTISEHLSDEQKQVAAFWDNNPFAVQNDGHLVYGEKKVSPGAHWMSIAAQVCSNRGKSFRESLLTQAVLAATMFDAFIYCWKCKYGTNRIRPETAIRKYIDDEWSPYLQTPPFPEYVSGHSVVSAAAAEVLSHFLGDSLAFTDSTEMRSGVAPRAFASFRDAAKEAAESRLYGGIHFRDAVEDGYELGREIGNAVVTKLN